MSSFTTVASHLQSIGATSDQVDSVSAWLGTTTAS